MARDKASNPTTTENTSTSNNKFFFGWWVAIAAVFLNIFQGGVLFYGFTVVILPMTEETGWSRTVVTGVFPIIGILAGILAPFLGNIFELSYLIKRFYNTIYKICYYNNKMDN